MTGPAYYQKRNHHDRSPVMPSALQDQRTVLNVSYVLLFSHFSTEKFNSYVIDTPEMPSELEQHYSESCPSMTRTILCSHKPIKVHLTELVVKYILCIYGGGVMITRIKKWGNSQGLRFSKEMLGSIGVGVNEDVNVEIHDQQIIITKAQECDLTIDQLFEGYVEAYKPNEVDWGAAKGREVW